MGAMEHPERRPPAWAFAVLAALAVAIAVVAVWRPWSEPVATVAAGVGEPVAAIAPQPLEAGAGARVLVFGDSWTWGQAAPETRGYAYVLAELTGWTTVVDGIRGSGYLRPGLDGPDFGTRIAQLDRWLDPDLVIVQGSINDRALHPVGYREAVDAAWHRLAEIYPDTPVVILGPAPHVLPVEAATAAIDADLATLAAERGWWYISPIVENWITDANYLEVIDTSDAGRNHPSVGGHQYLAERLAAAIAAISR